MLGETVSGQYADGYHPTMATVLLDCVSRSGPCICDFSTSWRSDLRDYNDHTLRS